MSFLSSHDEIETLRWWTEACKPGPDLVCPHIRTVTSHYSSQRHLSGLTTLCVGLFAGASSKSLVLPAPYPGGRVKARPPVSRSSVLVFRTHLSTSSPCSQHGPLPSPVFCPDPVSSNLSRGSVKGFKQVLDRPWQIALSPVTEELNPE